MDWFEAQSPLLQAFLSGVVAWAAVAAGAAGVALVHRIDQRLLDLMLGFAAGVMLAASFWSLLAPAIELAGPLDIPSWLPAASGLILGGLFLRLMDAVLPHLHPGSPPAAAEGVRTGWHRTTLLVTAITLHHIPEGLSLGIAFGAAGAAAGSTGAVAISGAVALTIGMAIQGFPEGAAVALPIRAAGL
ncbi:MAG: gufA, partial [Acidobacteria bacterium]|nr:gufA [Acidobacteriota bacterium]